MPTDAKTIDGIGMKRGAVITPITVYPDRAAVVAGWADADAAKAAADAAAKAAKDNPPAPTPAPTPVVPAPPVFSPLAITTIKAPNQPNRGVGIKVGPTTTRLGPIRYDGFGMNVVVDTPNPLTIDGLQSVNSWPDANPTQAPAATYWGQPVYVYHCPSLTVLNTYIRNAGIRAGMPAAARTKFVHGFYSGDESTDLKIKTLLVFGAASCGVQHRGSGILSLEDFAMSDVSIGIMAKCKGGARISGGVIFATGWNADVTQDNPPRQVFNGALGIFAQTPKDAPVYLEYTTIVLPPPISQGYSTPMKWMGNVTAGPGVKVVTGVRYDFAPICDQVDTGAMTVADAVAKIRSEVSKLA